MDGPIRDFMLDENNKVMIANGDFVLVGGEAAAEQGLGVRQRMIQGECILDGTRGIPWFTYIFQKGADPLVIKELFLTSAEAVPDVTSVVMGDVQIDSTTRQATVSEVVKTIYSASDDTGTPLEFEAPTP